ncbi:MAG TPA: metallophosphoesterase, partial [Burkholderiaceae bacterium]|nr:metallophosphoesterase [Burkholderiaceae bacterium]
MLLAILTDLHANREAVSACLDHAQHRGCERYAFLGDLVGYGAEPGWVVETVMHHVAHGAIAVLG